MKFEDLKFVSINSPGTSPEIIDMIFRKIPKRLFEQIKGAGFNIDLLYQTPSSFINNLNTKFYVLTDDKDKIKGVLWVYINILAESAQVQLLSIDKEYQFGNALEKTLEFIKSWSDKKLKVECMTVRPKAYERVGWKRSKRIILEIE